MSGEIRFIRAGTVPALGTVAVGLLPRSIAGSPERAEAHPTLRVVSTTAEFRPATRIARPGQPIVLENRGPLVHRIFSPRLDDRVLPLPPGERSESFSLDESGPARFYCSLHADERFVLMVVSAPWAAVASGTGEYRFGPLPAGRYTLWIWSERISGPVRDIVVDGYSRSFEPIWLDPALIDR
ncbi:MAG: hypothetical protein R3266_04820 [Gemmatimonadota bacterium]|nr:hypothetical protein [Gemmatimonadota bacterium]